jgi:hypothetical protein
MRRTGMAMMTTTTTTRDPRCTAYCDLDDAGAPGRHALIVALAAIGIESEEADLGAGCVSVYVPDVDGTWSFVNADCGDLYSEWGVEFHYPDGSAGCSHILNPTTDSADQVARDIRTRFVLTAHTPGDGDP